MTHSTSINFCSSALRVRITNTGEEHLKHHVEIHDIGGDTWLTLFLTEAQIIELVQQCDHYLQDLHAQGPCEEGPSNSEDLRKIGLSL